MSPNLATRWKLLRTNSVERSTTTSNYTFMLQLLQFIAKARAFKKLVSQQKHVTDIHDAFKSAVPNSGKKIVAYTRNGERDLISLNVKCCLLGGTPCTLTRDPVTVYLEKKHHHYYKYFYGIIRTENWETTIFLQIYHADSGTAIHKIYGINLRN